MNGDGAASAKLISPVDQHWTSPVGAYSLGTTVEIPNPVWFENHKASNSSRQGDIQSREM